ncbi:hypothetical protein [Pseudomonas sp. MGal98]|uniref:hypothetical protein n=1 Tax=Pseudomonas sp. MGal98 TaxID=3162460 RepID=UPI0032ECB6C5
MSSPALTFDPITAIGYIGQTVFVELRWEGDDEMLRRTYHLVGVALPVPGLLEHGYFLAMPLDGSEELPIEIYFDYINVIRITGDAHASVKTLDRLPLQQRLQGMPHATEGVRRHA